jgi:glycosidase
MDQVAGDLAQYRLAAASYLLQTGPVFLYYGEEIGMAGAASLGGDPKLRTPMSWTSDRATAGFTTGRPFRALASNSAAFNAAAQESDPASLLSFYRALINLRRGHPALAYGAAEDVSQQGQVLSFRRRLATAAGAAHAVVAINYGTAAGAALVRGLPPSAALTRGFPAGEPGATTSATGELSLTLPPQSVQILLLEP